MAKYTSKKKTLKRKSSFNRPKKTDLRIILIFVVVFAIVATASIITFLDEGGSDEEEVTESAITHQSETAMKESANILVAGVDTTEKTVYWNFVLNINTTEKDFALTCFAPIKKIDATNPDKFKEAVEEKYGIEIDRYVVITQSGFKEYVRQLGGYDVDLKNRVDYQSDDFSISLSKGEQTIASGDKLFNYIRFTGLNGSMRELEAQGEIIAGYMKQFMIKSNAEKGEDLFSALSNASITDISIIDYTNYQAFLTEVSNKKVNISVVEFEDLETRE